MVLRNALAIGPAQQEPSIHRDRPAEPALTAFMYRIARLSGELLPDLDSSAIKATDGLLVRSVLFRDLSPGSLLRQEND